MKPQAKVAVIIPFYNVEKYLSECLDSVINQSYKNLSIILVDDGSSDASSAIALDYFKRDYRISLICKANGGLSSARNAALEYLMDGLELSLLGVEEGLESKTYFSRALLKPTARSLAYSTIDYVDSTAHTIDGGGGGGQNL